jgi:hypothetical protein
MNREESSPEQVTIGAAPPWLIALPISFGVLPASTRHGNYIGHERNAHSPRDPYALLVRTSE